LPVYKWVDSHERAYSVTVVTSTPEPADTEEQANNSESTFDRFESLAKALVKVPKDRVDAIIKKRRKT